MNGVVGADDLIAALRRIPQQVEASVVEALEEIAMIILREMKRDAPRGTGSLRRAITVKFSEDGLAAYLGFPDPLLASDYFYARFVEMGTKGGVAYYRRAGSSKRHRIEYPPHRARPFMQPAVDRNRRRADRIMLRAISRAIERAG